jgi:hypothetical protein
MSLNEKSAATDSLLEELVTARREMDIKAKVTPVHILNDVSATMAKIVREVCRVAPNMLNRALTIVLPTVRCLKFPHGL